jgi:LysR family transcriptional regulator, transcriptional activator of the cysJI operon
MSLSSLNIDAFNAVAKYGNFSKASKALHITQSALSQRVMNLEDELGVSVFIREPNVVRLTESGELLLQYAQAKEKMENNTLDLILGKSSNSLRGEIKIATLSSLTRSIVFPALSEIIINNPSLHIEIYSREISQLDSMIRKGVVDITLSYTPISRQGWKNELLGKEKNVMCQAKHIKDIPDKYFDHDYLDSSVLSTR